jgi:carboxypeptidase C (cathepsin A)
MAEENDREKKKRNKPNPTDDLVTTAHSLGDLGYTVTTGRIVLREEKLTDDVFDGTRRAPRCSSPRTRAPGRIQLSRPVTFAFNGGPGSSSVWLHLGLLGPRRVDMGDAGALKPPPYGLTDNHETLLAASDLVFIDPISTGYSRASRAASPRTSTASPATWTRSAR